MATSHLLKGTEIGAVGDVWEICLLTDDSMKTLLLAVTPHCILSTLTGSSKWNASFGKY